MVLDARPFPCEDTNVTDTDTTFDHDGDGYSRLDDCDDSDASVHPGDPFTCVWSKLPVCTRGQEEMFTETAMEPPAAGSDTYVIPELAIRENLSLSISVALEGNTDESIRHATLANYNLCAEGSILLWSPTAGSGGASLAKEPIQNQRTSSSKPPTLSMILAH